MKTYRGPLENPTLEPLITQAVQAFAKRRRLAPTLWYHGEPRCLLRKEVEPQFFQEVQVAIFSTGTDEYLFCLPQAYCIEETGMKATRSQTEGEIVQYLVKDLLALDEPDRLKQIQELLTKAWMRAKTFTKHDLVC